MKKRQIIAITAALALTICSAALAGCAGREYTMDGSPVSKVPTETPASTAPADTTESTVGEEQPSAETPAEESSEEPSVEESSEEPSVEESSEEPSAEESSEEPSAEESSEEAVNGKKVTFVKPDNWSDTVNAYVYNSDKVENAPWPGVAMTDNGDGTYSYVVTDDVPDPLIIFNDGIKQYPRSNGEEVIDGQTYQVS